MSIILDAYQSIQNMSVANKGTGTTAQPTTAGFGGSVNQAGYSDSYGVDDSPYGGDTSGKALNVPSSGSSSQAITGPNMESPNDLQTGMGYVGLGTKAINTAKTLMDVAGYGKSAVGQGLGYAGQVGSALLTAYSAYKMATGEATTQDYVNTGIGAATYAANAYASADALATGLAGASTSAAPSMGASIIGSVGSYAVPYYALAKAGGMAINAITANNPWMKETPLGWLGQGLDEPLAVEDSVSGILSRHGIGNEKMWEGFNNSNPLEVGGWIKNTKDKAVNAFLTGGLTGLSDFTSELGNELGIDPGITAALTGGLSTVGGIGKSTEGTARGVAAIATGGLSEVFCFAAGTPITMKNGEIKSVQDINLLDECENGGLVNGTGVILSDGIYDYHGILVTGTHAVYENGQWIRVKNSPDAEELKITEPIKVYVVNNENHILMVDGIRFADYGEVTDSENMTADERLAYLNEHCRI